MPLTQENLALQITTPLGKDKLILTHFSGEERISGLFQFHLEMISESSDLSFDSIVGKNITVSITMKDTKKRIINGVVRRFTQAGNDEEYTYYQAEVVPWLWMLTLTRDSKIFQTKSVPDIIQAVFKDQGFTDFKNKLSKTYRPRDYCVQYQESAFDFISRLMEDEGIFYYFEHEANKHTLLLGDDSSVHKLCPEFKTARFGRSKAQIVEEDILTQCTLEQNVATGKYDMDDFNFETPTTDLIAKASGKASKMRMYEYPGDFTKKDVGSKRADTRLEGLEWPIKILRGSGHCKAFCPGFQFDLREHYRKDMNATYTLSRVSHKASQDDYMNTFQAFPKDIPYRPSRATPKPIIPGAQTAMVVGKKGEEIWTDKYGRIKVQFHWDQEGKKDENSSCWVRVASTWAGKNWGNIYIPRIGQEVVVSFEEGNPDRPLVTGSVYNSQTTVPYTLPANQTQSTIKSNSSKGSGGFNEIRFEDKKDKEEIFVHAQKDMNVEVENDRSTCINEGNDTLEITKGYRKTTISKGNDTLEISKGYRKTSILKGNDTLEIAKGNRTFKVKKGKENYSVKGKRTLNINDNEAHTNKKNFTHKVKGNYILKVTGNITIKAGGTVKIESGKGMTHKAGMSMTNNAKMSITNKAKMSIKNDAKMSITNKAKMSIKNDAKTSITNKGGVSLTNEGGVTHNAKAGAMMVVKGALVKIN